MGVRVDRPPTSNGPGFSTSPPRTTCCRPSGARPWTAAGSRRCPPRARRGRGQVRPRTQPQPALELQRGALARHHPATETSRDLLDQGEHLLVALSDLRRSGRAAEGLALASRQLVPRPCSGVMRDLDVLIPIDRAADAVRAVERLGYEPSISSTTSL